MDKPIPCDRLSFMHDESKEHIERKLQERVKELRCLYAIAQVSGNPTASLETILNRVIKVLPEAWQEPERAHARIELDDGVFGTPDLPTSGKSLTEPITVRGQKRGSISVGYGSADIPVLAEEKKLLMEVARQVGLIIDRRETAEEQQRLQAKLQHADRLATIGKLAAGVAHELNEPLGGILGFTQLLAKTPDLPPQARKDLARIEAATLHARDTIRRLMTFARQTPPRDIRLDLNRLIKESESIWQPRCSASSIQIDYALEPDLPDIVADDGQLRQMVTNLIVNGIQAMPDGGRLHIATARDGDWLELTVSDTGCGIDPDVLPSIFDPFFTTKDIDEGTGLGLSVVHGIVTGHGGKINLTSTSGQGATATVRLPLCRPSHAGAHNEKK